MLKFKEKLSYGIGGISDNALYTLTGTYLLLFLTTVSGINASAAGTICAIGSIWEALIGPVIGYRSDRTNSPIGKRRPFLLAASVPIMIVTTLLFTKVGFSANLRVLYYGMLVVLFWSFFSCEFIPYISWGADLTEDYHERTVLRSYSYVFNQIGMLIGMVLPSVILDITVNLGISTENSWSIIGAFVGILAGTSLIISALTLRDRKTEYTDISEKESIGVILREYISILKLKPLIPLLLSSVAFLIAEEMFNSSRVFYITYNLLKGDRFLSLVMLTVTLSGIVFVPFVTALSKRTDKKIAFMAGIGISGILMVIMRFINVSVIITCVVYAFANTCYWQLMPSMMYDVCLFQEVKEKTPRSGSIISVQALSESISMAFGIQLLGILLDRSGFDSFSAVQNESALSWISSSFTLIPGIFMILVFIFMLFYPINRKVFETLSTEVEKVRNGEEICDKTIEMLF